MADLSANGYIELEIAGNTEKLEEADLLIESSRSDEYVTDQDGDLTVVLSIKLNDELIEEGFVRTCFKASEHEKRQRL